VLILSEPGGVGSALVRALAEAGAAGEVVAPASDAELSEVLGGRWAAVAVVTRDDVLALRLTLLCGHVRGDLPLWTTLFDRTLSHRLHEDLPHVNIVASAEIVARELAERCAAMGAGRPRRWAGVRLVDGALRLVVGAGAGLLGVLVIQTVVTAAALHERVLDGIYFSTRVIATVADAPGSDRGPVYFKVVSIADTVAAVVLLAVFTAALVRRLNGARLTTVLGPRRAPARGHVVIVGFGQVGFRLAQALRDRHVPVIAVERRPDAAYVRLARTSRIPLVIARGDDRGTLELVGIKRCAAVAAVTSDDLVNVSVGLTANDIKPGVPLALRLGDGGVATETESLLHLGTIVDAHHLAATILATAIAERVLGAAQEAQDPRVAPPQPRSS
jgi:voltage-gated potassium channel Kch